jgi:hypothetical protein
MQVANKFVVMALAVFEPLKRLLQTRRHLRRGVLGPIVLRFGFLNSLENIFYER